MDVKKWITEFEKGAYSLLADTQSGLYTSHAGGILPIIKPLTHDAGFFEQAIVIDRVIGKAAALLLIKGQVKFVHADLMSLPAKEVLETFGIAFSYRHLCNRIQNKEQTGLCPMEASVLEISDPEIAYEILAKKLSHVL
jgi:iron complex outermembrane receptor protein